MIRKAGRGVVHQKLNQKNLRKVIHNATLPSTTRPGPFVKMLIVRFSTPDLTAPSLFFTIELAVISDRNPSRRI
jgi:hypothetical protein